jgi:hypothetical protein
MAKIYLVQHQAHGVVHEFPFSAPPSEAQLEKVWTYCFGIHGASHAKSPSEPFWQIVKEVEVLGPGETPKFDAPGLRVASSVAATGDLTVSAVGHVTPKDRA